VRSAALRARGRQKQEPLPFQLVGVRSFACLPCSLPAETEPLSGVRVRASSMIATLTPSWRAWPPAWPRGSTCRSAAPGAATSPPRARARELAERRARASDCARVCPHQEGSRGNAVGRGHDGVLERAGLRGDGAAGQSALALRANALTWGAGPTWAAILGMACWMMARAVLMFCARRPSAATRTVRSSGADCTPS
jgi:hypothetical protein